MHHEICRALSREATHLERLPKFLFSLELNRRDMSQTGLGEETIRVRERNEVFGELHGVQPIPQVFDLS
jgi:hypothetical protein